MLIGELLRFYTTSKGINASDHSYTICKTHIRALFSNNRVQPEVCSAVFTKCLQQETDRELVTTIFDTLPVLMRILEFAAFLRVQALQSWCAAFVAFLVHVTVANADMSLALSTGNVRQDALPAVDSSVVVGLRSLLRIVNEWPEACNGKSPF